MRERNMRVEAIPATAEQAPVLGNLLELYAHDFSEFFDIQVGEDGRFGYASLPLYWSEAGRFPLLLRVDGLLAGFALVKRGASVVCDAEVWDMAEFFVLRGYRRRGVGMLAAREVWKRFPGPWEVRVMESNAAARGFWARSIAAFTGGAVEPARIQLHGAPWLLFRFESV